MGNIISRPCIFMINVKGYTQLFIKVITVFVTLIYCSACSDPNSEKVDHLNTLSYSFHYRSLDSTQVYAQRAYQSSDGYSSGRAEALNNLAFVSIARMDYTTASNQLQEIQSLTDNQVELLISDIQMMRLCQRQSENKDFYNYRERALRRLDRIKEEDKSLSPRLRKRMIYAQSELFIVASTYFYYIGLPEKSIQELYKIDINGELQKDTAQWLNYLYNIGAGGMVIAKTKDEINQREFSYLFQCYTTAQLAGFSYWEANAMQGISEHLNDKAQRRKLIKDNPPAFALLNMDHMPDSLLAGNLAQRSLEIFARYGDVYQTAGAYRTLASCYWVLSDYKSALFCLQNALHKNVAINKAPDLVASICEQLCLVYSAMNMKKQSDFNRNKYLDIQEQSRQDRQLEARADQLARSSRQLNIMIMSVIIMIVLVIFLLFVFNYMRQKQNKDAASDELLEPLRHWETIHAEHIEEQNDRYEELKEQQWVMKAHVVENKKRNLEQRAKVSLANSVIPFIDRMRNEIHRLAVSKEMPAVRNERYAYIAELTDKIKDYNEILTNWIQMRQGELSLHIESVALQSLFDIVRKRRMEFRQKGIDFIVDSTELSVKADRTLTLFMINTIVDNARKFTMKGGVVRLSAETLENGYVEIKIADNGVGMSEEEITHLFEHKIINSTLQDVQTSHGFGLMNCKGIIDKYRKISKIFKDCSISVQSKKGKGSIFSFKLPKGMVYVLLSFCLVLSSVTNGFALKDKYATLEDRSRIQQKTMGIPSNNALLNEAKMFADSAYLANINGKYSLALQYSDSCIDRLNRYYLSKKPLGKNLMVGYSQSVRTPAEIQWFYEGFPTNFSIILDIRNESSIAALALHKWSLYHYNNNVYIKLLKEYSADNTLRDYCVGMQNSETNKMISIIILILLLLLILPAYYILYYRHVIMFRMYLDMIAAVNRIISNDDTPQNKLKDIHIILSAKNNMDIENDRFTALNTVISKIRDVLERSIELENDKKEHIEWAEDELKKLELENDKLYVNNSVLDNCLSALKHETMYYPSRIRQLVDGGDKDLKSMTELVDYYKELYGLLSAQAMRLLEENGQAYTIVPVDVLLHDFMLPVQFNIEWSVAGDADLLKYLFAIIKKELKPYNLKVEVQEKGRRYVLIKIRVDKVIFTADECSQLFSPTTVNLQYYLCSQIVRDVGGLTNARGCGIFAHNTSEETVFEITLPRVSAATVKQE